jgi:hypothetical protein
MPTDYLSRHLASSNKPVIAVFDPFQTNLPTLQREEDYFRKLKHFNKNHHWPPGVSQAEANSLTDVVKRMFLDKDNILWIRLTDYKYPRTALLLPKK